MRGADYATGLATAILPSNDGVHECRLERIFVTEENQEETRFSCWKTGNNVPGRAFHLLGVFTACALRSGHSHASCHTRPQATMIAR
jgi:hypothetical protein